LNLSPSRKAGVGRVINSKQLYTFIT
jgi:hypothetical protein